MTETAINITRLIDDRPITRFQLSVFLLCALVVFLDGVDTQVIGITAPMISQEHGIARSALGWIFSAGTLGATIGALSCGLIADRIGRKTTLIASTACFGIFTMATTLAGEFSHLVALRFLTGLGLGGAVPCFVAMTSEYAPARRRATIVSLMWAAFPLGGMSGGFLNSYLVTVAPWQFLFHLWGALPIVVAFILALFLPESVRFLLTARGNARQIDRIVARIAPDLARDGATYVADEEPLQGSALRHLFDQGRTLQTLPIWIASFLVFGTLTVTATWTPALLTSHAFTASDAAVVVGFNGLGAFLGTCCAGRLIERLGVARSVIPGFLFAAIATAYFGTATHSLIAVSLISLIAGVFLGLSSSGVVALSALTYPTAIRSTGIGWALGMGRFGSVLTPITVGGLIGAGWQMDGILLLVGLSLLIAIPGVWTLSRHRRAGPGDQRSSETQTLKRVGEGV